MVIKGKHFGARARVKILMPRIEPVKVTTRLRHEGSNATILRSNWPVVSGWRPVMDQIHAVPARSEDLSNPVNCICGSGIAIAPKRITWEARTVSMLVLRNVPDSQE